MVTLALFLFPAFMAFAASSDLLAMKISNRLVIALTVTFFIVAIAVNLPLEQIGMHLLCAAVVLLCAFVMFAFGWIGGGDAKLAAATTLWLGFGVTLPYLLFAGMLGGLLTLLILSFRRLPLTPLIARWEWIARLHDKKSGVPYGIAMAVAAIMVYSNTVIFERLIA
ncbi:prepilin peptidase [Devosia sp. Leaf64]|jgi:prepilin peptidase CpaA|uniref:A24 family peptidase n=1 Tax=Devosia sp. Leaf64 TaxID=1736229 RepID=UPI000715F29F|nr:prepilin peptidase [Devosia sp. Leaf64]KQN76858.1 peptidase [Devosia sp. Leaf64]